MRKDNGTIDYELNSWEDFKSITWNKNPNQRIAIDELNYTMVMKRDEKIVFIDFQWTDGKFVNLSDEQLNKKLERLAEIKKEALSKFETSHVELVSNYHFNWIGLEYLKKFPDNINYYLFRDGELQFKKKSDLIKDVKEKNRKNRPYRAVKNKKTRSLFNYNYEKAVMKAIEEGTGDKIGF